MTQLRSNKLARRLGSVFAIGVAIAFVSSTTAYADTYDEGTTFNTPDNAGGSSKQQDVFPNTIVDMINDTPKGETIDISIYSLNKQKVVDAIVKAHHDRDVNIRYVTWDEETDATFLKQLKDELGTKTSSKSYLLVCKGSCRKSGSGGTQHAKAITFSQTGKQKNVTVIGSGNFTGGGGTQWNEFQTIPDNETIYKSVKGYFDGMKDKNAFDYPAKSSGIYKVYYFPRKSSSYDPVYSALKDTSCKDGGKIRVAMFNWTKDKLKTAKQVVKLKKAGCDVGVVYTGSSVDDEIKETLINGKVKTYDADNDGMIVHAKTTIIDAKVDGKQHHYVFSGSTNFAKGSYLSSTNMILRTDSASEVKDHLKWFDKIVDNSKKATLPKSNERRTPVTEAEVN